MPFDRFGQFLMVVKAHDIFKMTVRAANVVLTRKISGRLNIDQSENECDGKNKENYRSFIVFFIVEGIIQNHCRNDDDRNEKKRLRRVVRPLLPKGEDVKKNAKQTAYRKEQKPLCREKIIYSVQIH